MRLLPENHAVDRWMTGTPWLSAPAGELILDSCRAAPRRIPAETRQVRRVSPAVAGAIADGVILAALETDPPVEFPSADPTGRILIAPSRRTVWQASLLGVALGLLPDCLRPLIGGADAANGELPAAVAGQIRHYRVEGGIGQKVEQGMRGLSSRSASFTTHAVPFAAFQARSLAGWLGKRR